MSVMWVTIFLNKYSKTFDVFTLVYMNPPLLHPHLHTHTHLNKNAKNVHSVGGGGEYLLESLDGEAALLHVHPA